MKKLEIQIVITNKQARVDTSSIYLSSDDTTNALLLYAILRLRKITDIDC